MTTNLYAIKARSDGMGPWFEINSPKGRIFIFKFLDNNYYCRCSAENHANIPVPYKTGKTLAAHIKKANSTWCGTEPIIPYEVYMFFLYIKYTAKKIILG